MKMIEIEMCNPNCSHLVMRDFNSVFCYHPKWHLTTNRRRRIPYSRLNGKHKFPVWCPLPDVEEKKTYKDNLPKISPEDFAKARDGIGLRFKL